MLTVVGMGPAGQQWLTPAAQAVISGASGLVGARRHLAQFPDFDGETFTLGADIPALLDWLAARLAENVVVLASGDPLLFGIGKRLVDHFGIAQVRVLPGISAVQYLCAQAGVDMNDMWLTSSHGRQVDFDQLVRQNKVAMVTDSVCGPREIAAGLVARGMGHRWMVIGENLAMENERIRWQRARDETDGQYAMNVVVILNER